jgi:hypothetical protein
MLSRLAIALLLVGILPCTFSLAQETSGVLIGGAGERLFREACGLDGQAYFSREFEGDRSSPSSFSLVRFSRDGSKTIFALPTDLRRKPVVAESSSGVSVLAADLVGGKWRSVMYHFDSQGNLLSQHQGPADLMPMGMAVTASGRTVIVASWRDTSPQADPLYGFKNGGVVLGTDDQVIKHFALPLPPNGGGWVFDSRLMAGDDAAYIMLHSNEPGASGLAKIREDGELEIKIIPNAIYNDERHHDMWTFGPGVLVEEYRYVGERATFHFDEYDLNTGERTRSRYAFVYGNSLGCYWGNEVSLLTQTSHPDPVRGFSPDTTRLAFGKLQDQPVSKPVVNPDACNCAPKADHCPAATEPAALTTKH